MAKPDLHSAAGGEVADQHGHSHDEDRGQGGLQAQGNAADDDSGGAGLGGVGELLGGLVSIGGVVLSEVADGAAPNQAAQNGHIYPHLAVQDKVGQRGGQNGRQDCGSISTSAQGAQQRLLGGILLGFDQEGAEDGTHYAAHSQQHGKQQAAPTIAAHSA